MEYLTLLGTVAFILLTLYVLFTERKWKNFPNLLPGPLRFPIIGSMIQIGWIMTIGHLPNYEKFCTLCKRYGKTFGFQAGVQYYVVTQDLETAKELMNSEIWHQRLSSHPMYKSMTFGQNIGILEGNGADWREIRKFTIRTLIDQGLGNMNSADVYIAQEIEFMLKDFDAYRAKMGNDILIHQYFNICVVNVIWKFIAGTRFEYNDQHLRKILKMLDEGNRLIQLGANPEGAFPVLRFIPGLSQFGLIHYIASHLHQLYKDIMVERRVHGNYRHVQNDFIDHFLRMIDEEKDDKNSIYHDEQFIQCGTDLLIAGIDTTSNSIEFTLLYLTKYPEVQKKLRDEIDAVVGRNRQPNVFDKPNMPYAEAVVLEVLRNANIIPINTRCNVQATKLNGYDVPEESIALINLVQLHKDKKIWGDPEVFRPERFLDEKMNIINKDKVFAFGYGKRICIGITMAKLMWFTFITTLVQKYTFEQSPVHPELSLSPNHGFANLPRPFHCVVKLRNANASDE